MLQCISTYNSNKRCNCGKTTEDTWLFLLLLYWKTEWWIILSIDERDWKISWNLKKNKHGEEEEEIAQQTENNIN